MFSIRSLRVRTVLWASIPVVLVLTVVILITPHLLEDVARTVAQQRDVELARISAARLSERLGYHSRALELAAADDQMRSMTSDSVSRALKESRGDLYVFDGALVVYNNHGIAIASEPPTPERKGELFPVSSKLEEVSKTLRPAFSDVFKDTATQENVILVAVPIINAEGVFVGVLTGMATLKYSPLGAMYAKLLEFKAGRRGYAYLVDGKGTAIYHRHSPLVGRDLRAALPVKRVVAGKTGSDITRDAQGETIIVGFAPVPGTDWGLITQETWDLIIKPIRRDRMLLLSLLAAGGALASALIFFAVTQVLRPINKLTTGAQRIAEGDFDYAIEATSGDEIQVLSEQFNSMAAALKKSYADLEQRVLARTADLAIEKERAEEADRTKSSFLATMSHELRTPLNSIIGFTGVMLQGLAGPITAEQEKQMTMVYRNAKHLLSLINDVLDLSKLDADKVVIRCQPFDLPSLVEKAVASMTPQAQQKGLKLEVDLAEEIGTMTSDERRVEQVLLNLLDNAIKFTEKGWLRVEGRIIDKQLRITVQDTGIGIRAEDMDKLFTTFRQLESTATRTHYGTGLGLVICKKLITMLRGTIRAESEYGVGTRFIFALPLDEEASGGEPNGEKS
jgi:signal transduction histidine kinase